LDLTHQKGSVYLFFVLYISPPNLEIYQFEGEIKMSKSHDAKKDSKKAAQKTKKEKRAAKREKRNAKK